MSRRIGGHVSVAGGIVNAIKNTQEINGNCMQIFVGSPRVWARDIYPPDQIKEFNQKADELNLRPVFIHALYLVNLASDKKELVEKSTQALLTDMKNGDAINSEGVIVHIGSHQGRGFDSVQDQLVTQIEFLLSNTQKVPFVIENSAGQKGKVGSIDQIAVLIKKVNDPRLKVCLDTAHLFAAGWDLRQENVVDDLVSKLKDLSLLDKLACLHINDSKGELDSAVDQHANIGEGEIGKKGLSNLINHPDLKDLPLILEVPGFTGSGPDAENIKITQEITRNE